MPHDLDRQPDILTILENFHGLEPLRKLFWTELNYNRENLPLPYQDNNNDLATEPILWATGGKDNAFHVIYAQLNSDRLRLTAERRVITQLLKDHLYALFIFSNRDQTEWHIVNVRYDADDPDRRRLYRRITIRADEKLRTASERIAMLDLASIDPDDFDALSPLPIQARHDEAFNVEAVTARFFEDYKAVFQTLQNLLTEQTNDPRWAHDYALQFLNRCMFLYFIQRKGWLGEETEFLRLFWESYQETEGCDDSFVDKWLNVLFFEAFNNRFHGGHRHFPDDIREALAVAPYLNGGLFKPNDLDTAHNTQISDAHFTAIFDFFESYNFTIAEDSPLDQEVAVDPEMIGRVYESLVNVSIETDERGDAGIFYTSRTEIDLMCRLALVDNLTNHVGESHKNHLYEAIFAFDPDDKAASDKTLADAGLWESLDTCLKGLTVVDPACGSGSFLVGMLHVLDDLHDRANQQLGREESSFDRKKRIIGHTLYGVDVMEWACHVAELRLWLSLIIDADLPHAELHVRDEPLLPHFSFNIRCGDSLVQDLKHGIDDLRQLIDGPREQQMLLDGTVEARVARQLERQATEWQKQIDALTQDHIRLTDARNALVGAEGLFFVWDIAFVEIFTGEKGGFDIVIGNPPYVRQENISDPTLPRQQITNTNKKAYKAQLARSVYQAFPRFFDYKPEKDLKRDNPAAAVTHKLDAKSDLYIYFYFHGLSLLNPNGTFCFITSNSWLDVDYGKDLQAFTLKHCHIKQIIDNQARRSFASADVNTVICLFSAPDPTHDSGLDHIARFVTFTAPFEGVLDAVIFEEVEEATHHHTTPEHRIFPIPQQALLEAGASDTTSPTKYSGDKWGGKYLRAPDIYWTILERGQDKLVRLEDVADVRYGIKTGVNAFFYFDAERIAEWEIEDEFLKPVVKSPRECKSILIDPNELKFKLFMCAKDKADLKGTAALEYIKWGESQGFHEKKSCKGRAQWYGLGGQMAFDWLVLIFRDKRNWTPINETPSLLASNVVFTAVLQNRNTIQSANAVANSTLAVFVSEIYGRVNLGDGLLTTYGPEILRFDFISPDWIDAQSSERLSEAFEPMKQREILPIFDEIHQPDRRALDTIIFDILNLTQGERDGVYEAVVGLAEARLQKAKSLKG